MDDIMPNPSSPPSYLQMPLDISMLSNWKVPTKDDQILYLKFTSVIIYAASSGCEITWELFILVKLPCRRCYVYIRCRSATGEWVEYDGIVTVSGLQDTTLHKTHEYILKKKHLLTAGIDKGTERYNATKLSKLQGSQITSLPIKCKGVYDQFLRVLEEPWPCAGQNAANHTAPRTGDPQCLGIKVKKSDRCLLFVPQPEVVLLIPLSSLASLETDRCIKSQLGCLCQSCVTACFVPQDETRAERLLRFACNCDSHLTAANIQCNVTSFGLQLLAVIFQLFQLFLRFQCENTKRLRKGGPRRLLNRRQMLKISIANKTGLQNNQFEECQGQGATTAGKLVSRHVLLHFFSSNPVNSTFYFSHAPTSRLMVRFFSVRYCSCRMSESECACFM